MISAELSEELKIILEQDYGIILTPEEANKIGSAWVEYFDLLATGLIN